MQPDYISSSSERTQAFCCAGGTRVRQIGYVLNRKDLGPLLLGSTGQNSKLLGQTVGGGQAALDPAARDPTPALSTAESLHPMDLSLSTCS